MNKAGQQKLKQRLLDKKHSIVTYSWLMNGEQKERTISRRIVSNEKMRDRVNRVMRASFSAKTRQRNKKSFKEGNNAIIFFNKKRGHAVKVFGQGSIGDHYSKTRTFQQNLSYCLAMINGQTISELDSNIKKIRARVKRMKSSKINPNSFDPKPETIIRQLIQEKKEVLVLQQEKLKDSFWNSKPLKKGYIPFVYSIRTPKIFSEHRLKSREYAVSMEYVRGPNLSELLEALDKKVRTKTGRNAELFLKQNKLDKEETRVKITEISKAINNSVLPRTQNTVTPFIPRLDSFIVEGIDRFGNFKLVLVDNA